jgi:hypothetical protein
MSVYTIVPNQPLGWSETIPTDECGCEKHEYCAPLLFELNNYVYEAYTARAVADGALPSDRSAACMEEVMDTFYEISRAIRYVSENISFLYEKDGEQQACDNLGVILEDDRAVVLTDETTLLEPEDRGYFAGAIGFNTQGGGPEPIPQSMDFTAYDFLAQGCVNTFGFTITPDEGVDFPWTILITNEYGDIYEIESGVDPAAAFSVTFDMVIGPNGFTIDVPADGANIFEGIISLRAMFVPCTFEPLGLVTSESSEIIGELVESETSLDTFNGVDYGIFNGKIGVIEITPDIKCAYIKFGSECCCTEVFYSKCIKPLTDPCHTVKIEYWQTPTTTTGASGFGFYYPPATAGNEFKQFMRVWGEIRNPQYDGEMEMYQDSFGRKSVVYAESREYKSFIINYSPEYVHNALRLACRHDNFELTDVSYNIIAQNSFTRSEAYSPSWIRISRLAPVTIEVEKKTQNLVGGSSKTFCS